MLVFYCIHRFCLRNEEGCGYVLKMPFTTNSAFVRYPSCYSDVLESFKVCCKSYASYMPYVMLQPCMCNKRENKVVVVAGKALYISENKNKSGRQYSFGEHKELFEFCEDAVKQLKHIDGSFQSDGLVRVDVFVNQLGDFVVNEFESLEANYYSTKNSVDQEAKVTRWLFNFWLKQLREQVPLL